MAGELMNVHSIRGGAAALRPAGLQPSSAVVRLPGPRMVMHGVLAVAVAAIVAAVAADRWMRWTMIESIPVPAGAAGPLFAAPVVMAIQVSAGGQHAPWITTDDELRNSAEIWKRMHLSDWNDVPEKVQAAGLDNMLRRYGGVLNNPAAWDRMNVNDWDSVPQPVRIVAYRRMVAYWSGFYHVGAEFDLPAGAVADILAAIVMSESWFEHRARSLNRDGTWDVGLAQASAFARERLRALHVSGIVDAAPGDEEHYKPWMASRFVALWMKLMLAESNGDMARAIRAYNRGSADAMDALGADYLAAVQQRLTRYIRNVDAPPSWDYVWRRSRQLLAAP